MFLLTNLAFAQQQTDPVILQRTIEVLEGQRNQAFNREALAEIRAAGLAADLAKASAKIKELETKSDKPSEEK